MKAVILAAGRGDNLLPYTEKEQKEAIQVSGKAVVRYVVEGLWKAGIREFVVVVNDKGKQIEDALDSIDASMEFIRQVTPGISGAIRDGMERVDDYFVLAFGDIIAPDNFYSELIGRYNESGRPVLSTVPVYEGLDTYGLVKLNERLHIVKEGSTLALAGAYVLPKGEFSEFLDYLESIADRAAYFIWSGPWVDVGFPEDLLSAIENLLNRKDSFISNRATISSTAIIGKNVVIEEGAIVEDYAILKGPAYIGKNAYVGSFSLIRDYSSIEEGAVIGAYCEVAHSLIGRRAVIGSKSYITHSVIGTEARIGASAVTISYPAALKRKGERKFGALISPGGELSHGSLVGPAFRK
jgi:Nucleoside-diphosphate-sugar pyrophosphorylase involved in lipopolysaccharide biosynthesis/translation initiation factor 2B, gamma/epsilon subunits (eIF-2Bgamma/eIF-2Bepsilon)